MDHRDWPLWGKAAKSHYARLEKAAAQAAAYPNLEEDARYRYMENLVNEINGTLPEFLQQPTPEMEAEWAANRAELGAIYGRLS